MLPASVVAAIHENVDATIVALGLGHLDRAEAIRFLDTPESIQAKSFESEDWWDGPHRCADIEAVRQQFFGSTGWRSTPHQTSYAARFCSGCHAGVGPG
jgi:hypothetical protein